MSLAVHAPSEGDAQTFFAVGTMLNNDTIRYEPAEGRIVLLRPSRTSDIPDSLSAMASVKANGCVYALRSVDGFIIAAINSAVSDPG